ncbi:MAG: endonuclease III [Alphaproteobacteria bacterium]|nr:endonuclease III [Alphaproteobacteria bacterium]
MKNRNEEINTEIFQNKKIAAEICKRLSEKTPNPKSELHYDSDYTFLLAVVMSAQTTDVQVNKVTKELFKTYSTIDDILNLGQAELQEKIKSIGFYKNKAKHIIELSKILKEKYNGKVPNNRADLESLPGVGRKTANVILNTLFNKPTIAVDTHVLRLSKRLGFSESSNPEEVEADLEFIIPDAYKNDISNLLILHGRYTCKAQKPQCETCILKDLCLTHSLS